MLPATRQRWRLKVDRVSIERMCAGKEFRVEGADTEKGPRGKVTSNTGWSGREICIGRTQGSGWKIVRNGFRQVERLRGMTCFPDNIFLSLFEFSTHRGTGCHPLQLFYPDPRVSVRAYCFPVRAIVVRSRLPASLVLAENIHMFRKLLKHVDSSYAMFGMA